MRRIAILIALVATSCGQVLSLPPPTLQPDAAVMAPDVGSIPPDAAPTTCSCTFGCDPVSGACRPPQLWVYLSAGSYNGAEFAGLVNPPDARGGADKACRDTYVGTPAWSARGCTRSHTHAILSVSDDDVILDMQDRFGVPGAAPLYRIDDAQPIAEHWYLFTDGGQTSTLNPIASPATAPDESHGGLMWIGDPKLVFTDGVGATCSGWSTAAPYPAVGLGRDATISRAVFGVYTCDQSMRLACICWSGPSEGD